MEPNHKHRQQSFFTLLQKPSSTCRQEYHHNAGSFHPSDLVTFRPQQHRIVPFPLPYNTQTPAILKKQQQNQQEVPPTNQECLPSSPSLPLTAVPNSFPPAIRPSALRPRYQQECYPTAALMTSIISALQEKLRRQQAERDNKATDDLWMINEGFGDWTPPEIFDADVIGPKDNPPPSPPPQQQVKEFLPRSLKDLSSPEKPHMKKGRWSDEEHRLFLEGTKLYPNQWKKIAKNCVLTRTATQVASHHQKFVLGLAGTGRRSGRRPKKQERRSSPAHTCHSNLQKQSEICS